jgi:NAD(P)-dependent dehydrogenase (short-subunit alcohol dehydrogenase family)
MTELGASAAIITGASGGLGARFARVLSRQGLRVALTARRIERLEALAAEIAADGGHAEVFPLDIAEAAGIASVFDSIEASMGPISVLVNNAGVTGAGRALEIDIATFDQTFAVNVRGPFFAAREAAKRMIENGAAAAGRARIVNIASIAAHKNMPGLSAYCASKAALVAATKTLALEWARHGIAVNALCPGYIETEMNADWFATEGGQKQTQSFPRRRLMDESALDDALLLLTGPGASAITGAVLTIDDGQSL